jgi:hypothetical protein
MKKETFSNWLTETDKSMAKVKKKILLPDNCSAHKVDVRLENVKLEFLPASCMSLLRPLHQGILQNAKVQFRKRLVQQMLINIQKKLPTKITVLQGLQMITGGWWNTARQIIHNCWRKTGILDRFQEDVTEASLNEDTSCVMRDDLAGKLELPPSLLTFKDYVSIDKEEETMHIMDDALIVKSVSSPPEEEDDEPEPEHVSPEEASRCAEKLKIYIGKK